MNKILKKPYVLEQGPLITRKQADSYALERGGRVNHRCSRRASHRCGNYCTHNPQTGRETRLEIKNAGASAMNGMKETTTVAAGKVKDAASGITSKIKDKFLRNSRSRL